MVHRSQPRALSITQPSEWGTVYSKAEVRKISDYAHQNGLFVHTDGARLANAAASLDGTLKELTFDLGIDVLSFGGTKNGLMGAEAVLFANSELAGKASFYQKQGMQLASKMRFLAVQFEALMRGSLWLENARRANAMAGRLASGVKECRDIKIVCPVETNVVFASVPGEIIRKTREAFTYHLWDESRSIVRWMTAFDTSTEDVDAFVCAIREALAS